MVLDHYDGIVMSEIEHGRYDLPYFIVFDSTGSDRCTRKEFHGEAAYANASRYMNDIVVPMIYGK